MGDCPPEYEPDDSFWYVLVFAISLIGLLLLVVWLGS